jgi:hypothetical protein
MSTRSRIGFETASGAVMHIYCHFDGYVEGVGQALIEDHNDVNKAYALVNGGACRSIRSRAPNGVGREVQRFSPSEGSGLEVEWSSNRQTYKVDATNWCEEYQYLWDSHNARWLWRHVSNNENWKRVDIALRNKLGARRAARTGDSLSACGWENG